MSRKRFPDVVFSVTHYLSKKEETDNAKVVLRLKIPITGLKNVSDIVKKQQRKGKGKLQMPLKQKAY